MPSLGALLRIWLIFDEEGLDPSTLDGEGFARFMDEVASHVQRAGILTISTKSRSQKWDVTKTRGGIRFGVDSHQSAIFPRWFLGIAARDRFTGIILRTFTAQKDEPTGYPIKELRGYFAYVNDRGRLVFRQMSARDVAEASTTHAETGKFLAPERGVVYCGPGYDYLDDSLNPIPRRP